MTIEQLQEENKKLNARLAKAVTVFKEQKENLDRLTAERDSAKEDVVGLSTRITELEAKLKRIEVLRYSEQNELKPVKQPEPVHKVGPSMIVHRTQDANADEVRMLRIEMEEAIKENAALRSQLINIEQDIGAMHEENIALKALMRTAMAEEKK